MRKYIYLLGILLFIGLFIASPYVLDYWQNKSALEAAGGMAVYEGILSSQLAQCQACKPYPVCCTGSNILCSASLTMPACTDQAMQVIQSAGGQKCPTGYLLSLAQVGYVQGAKNVILGGTTCTTLAVVASENGCLGCTAMINDSKVYLVKNKIKSVADYIIAGFRDKIK